MTKTLRSGHEMKLDSREYVAENIMGEMPEAIRKTNDGLLSVYTRGGQRPGAGRPCGSSKPDSRRNRLTQRYSDSELQLLTAAARRCGYGSDLTAYIRDRAINGAVIGVRSIALEQAEKEASELREERDTLKALADAHGESVNYLSNRIVAMNADLLAALEQAEKEMKYSVGEAQRSEGKALAEASELREERDELKKQCAIISWCGTHGNVVRDDAERCPACERDALKEENSHLWVRVESGEAAAYGQGRHETAREILAFVDDMACGCDDYDHDCYSGNIQNVIKAKYSL